MGKITGQPSARLLAIAAAAAASIAGGGAVDDASAAVPASLTDPASCVAHDPGRGAGYVRCDDGVPANDVGPGPGGVIPNSSGEKAVTVPAKYGGDGYTGLPPKAPDAAEMPGADAEGNVALDTAVTYPARSGGGRHPMLVFMHGCCGGSRSSWHADEFDAGGEKWHYSDAWFASRGYVVVTFTARGFVNQREQGSTGETQLDSRDYEINDYQHLACQLTALFNSSADLPDVDPGRVVTTGGSYGGGFSWLSITDPEWACTPDTGTAAQMRLAVSAPKYGWTDLAYTLVPTGLHRQRPDRLPDTDGCDTGPRRTDGSACPAPSTPVGTAKRSIVAGLYATGNLQSGNHTTFPPSIHEAFGCLNGPYPISANPSCSGVVDRVLPEFLADRSAYYQQGFFDWVAADPANRVPIFDAATFTDPLFPAIENRRMINRLRAVAPGYPIRAYYGDYQHFTPNKEKIWGDLCGPDRHVCADADYKRGFDADPPSLVKRGVTTMLNRFVDHYARPPANRNGARPRFDVTAELQVCEETADALGVPADESGKRFRARSFERIAPNVLSVEMEGERTTRSQADPNPHAASADPVANQLANGNGCVVETESAGPGVATYTSKPLRRRATMVGPTRVQARFEPSSAPALQLNARLYDVMPDGRAVLVDRGTRALLPGEGPRGRVSYELHGNGWRFLAGHRVRLELAQDDDPFVHASDVPSSLSLHAVRLRIPIRERTRALGGEPTARGRCANRERGGRGDDRIDGTARGDRIHGRRGDDVMRGRSGDDCIGGGGGRDRLRGGAGNDRLIGGHGRDRHAGGRGRDRIAAGRGADRLAGGRGSDRLNGGTGRDLVLGGRGRDRLRARDSRPDRLRCGGGRDVAIVDGLDRAGGCERVRRR